MTSPPAHTRALRLEMASVAWALVEAGASLAAGIAASSLALVAFGADSAIEMLSALIVIAELRAEATARSVARAFRLVAILFFALAAYVVVAVIITLVQRTQPDRSVLGMVVAASSLVFMPILAKAKSRAARDMVAEGSPMLGGLVAADAAETALCAVLGLSTLLGLVASSWLGWWWADPAASLVVVIFAVREGLEAWDHEID